MVIKSGKYYFGKCMFKKNIYLGFECGGNCMMWRCIIFYNGMNLLWNCIFFFLVIVYEEFELEVEKVISFLNVECRWRDIDVEYILIVCRGFYGRMKRLCVIILLFLLKLIIFFI